MAVKWGLVVGCLGAALLIACSDDDDGSGGGHGKADGGGAGDEGGGSGKQPQDGPACLVSATTSEIAVSSIDKVDLLFMVDNSNTMREEQAALRSQFAHLIQVLTSGDKDGDGNSDFPPVKGLHLGVVSSDMGLPGIDGIANCSGFGDDGLLQHEPSPQVQGCQASYPPFLSFSAEAGDVNAAANDLACIATLGTDGCGFEQQLESALKALWPSVDSMPSPDGSNRIKFIGLSGQDTLGHGDTENRGFLHNDPSEGLSLIAIVVVTDEEDCSSSSTKHFTPPTFLDPNDPLSAQPLNLRCFFNQTNTGGDELFRLERYFNGFKALRPNDENLVVFAAIAGVPPDLVGPNKLRDVDFGDPQARDTFYAAILNDSRMQEVVDSASMTVPGTGQLLPSCNTDLGTAFPPRRIVEVAHQFGENGIVQSICQEDLGPSVDAIVSVIAKQLGAPCLPRRLVSNRDGLVACDVIWELPMPGQAPVSTPTACQQAGWEFLRPPGQDHAKLSVNGGALCEVAQLAVKRDDSGIAMPVPTENDGTEFSQGWYYDDFSESVQTECRGPSKQRIAFTAMAKPPTGVTVKLECLSETLTIPDTRTDVATTVEQPRIGDACDTAQLNGQILVGDPACYVRLTKPSKKWPDQIDKSMFCHPQTNTCVLACSADADCPDDWSCDDSAAARKGSGDRAFCTPPRCSAGSEAASAEHVGDPCLPYSVPEGGYDDHEAYIGTSNEDCGGGVCLVYRLRGDPRVGCVVSPNPDAVACADPHEIRERVYCSCRCDARDGSDECKCPSGFSCQDVLEQGGPEVRGGYCVRDGT